MFFNWKEAHPDPADTQRVYMLATTVSSKILQAFARIEGFHFEVWPTITSENVFISIHEEKLWLHWQEIDPSPQKFVILQMQ